MFCFEVNRIRTQDSYLLSLLVSGESGFCMTVVLIRNLTCSPHRFNTYSLK